MCSRAALVRYTAHAHSMEDISMHHFQQISEGLWVDVHNWIATLASCDHAKEIVRTRVLSSHVLCHIHTKAVQFAKEEQLFLLFLLPGPQLCHGLLLLPMQYLLVLFLCQL